jgi:hypothetical protein
VSLGAGGALGVGTGDLVGLAAVFVSHPVGDFIFRIGLATETIDGATIIVASAWTSEIHMDYALLYGRRAGGTTAWVRAALGPALERTTQDYTECLVIVVCNTVTESSSSTVGLAGQLDAVWAVTRGFGLGLSAFGNLNSGSSFGGFTVGVHFMSSLTRRP